MFLILCIIWTIFNVNNSLSSELNNPWEIKKSISRLPKNVEPEFYNLTLLMNDKTFCYDGHVIIDLRLIQRSNSITLNADGLRVHQTRLQHENKYVPILSEQFHPENQFYIIFFNNTLKPGNYSLEMNFTARIRDDLFGFYQSTVKDDNQTNWMAVTQFSPIFARRAFPCFDEPYLKATFKLHIGHDGNHSVISNTMPEKIEATNRPNYYLTTMKTTPKMSTYLLGWTVHNLTYIKLDNNDKFVIWMRKSMKNRGLSSLKKGQLIFSALESYLGVSSPIEKMEHVAVPDFNFNAMENWGMITFRESAVLHDVTITPTKSIHEGLNTMGHEYAHTWFGNLVTPEFWNVAWLKEGFATYFSYVARALVDPDLKIMNLFVVENTQEALTQDSEVHNRTMNGRGSGEAEDAMGFLDFNAYKKGASIVRMAENIVGKNNFHDAIMSYLKNRSYDFSTPEIFYAHLKNYSWAVGNAFDIGDVIESYANQPGYPVITVTRNYSAKLMEISQERFGDEENAIKSERWWVPLSIERRSLVASNITAFGSIWLKPSDSKIVIHVDIDPLEWVICDIDKVGYYRVNYDDSNWNMLIAHLRSKGFIAINRVARATLISDSFSLAKSGYVRYEIPLQMANYLSDEMEYEPWFSAIKSFDFLLRMFHNSPALFHDLQGYLKRLLERVYLALAFRDGGDTRTKLLSNLVVATSCRTNNTDCLGTARSIFQHWVSNPHKRIQPDMKSAVYCTGIRLGNSEDWNQIYEKFIEEDFHSEKELLIAGLGCSNNSTLITKFLQFAVTHEGPALPKQYRMTIVDKILDGPFENVNHVLTFLSENLDEIIHSRGEEFLKKIFNSLKKKITTQENVQKLSYIIHTNTDKLGKSVASAREAIKYAEKSLEWIKKYSSIIAEVLKKIKT